MTPPTGKDFESQGPTGTHKFNLTLLDRKGGLGLLWTLGVILGLQPHMWAKH